VLLLQRKLDRRGVELLMMQQEVQELQARLQQQRCRAEDGEAAAAAYRCVDVVCVRGVGLSCEQLACMSGGILQGGQSPQQWAQDQGVAGIAPT
jgi:hypothetical protein